MLIRLRSRDGVERVKVPEDATVSVLVQKVAEDLGIPEADIQLSRDPSLLTAKEDTPGAALLGPGPSPLAALGVAHGDALFLRYPGERAVAGPPRSRFEALPFGAHMDVARMMAAQTRIERQEAADCGAVSFDADAIHAFQSYVSAALAFGIKRGGVLYGTVEPGDPGTVSVHAIYEPPQAGSQDSLSLERGAEEERAADAIAAALGWRRVGWVYSQSAKERDFIVSTEELGQMAECQDEVGPTGVTTIVAAFPGEDGQPEVHVEAFQVSRQCVALWKEGWFQPQEEPAGTSTLRNPKDPKDAAPVIVAGKDQGEVDNDYFLIPVSIKDHQGPLENAFPVENRLLPQGKAELRSHLQARSGKPFVQRIADFHLLLYLSQQPNFELADVVHFAEAVASGGSISEGYKLLIEGLAGIS